jgi:hypothetical protein
MRAWNAVKLEGMIIRVNAASKPMLLSIIIKCLDAGNNRQGS